MRLRRRSWGTSLAFPRGESGRQHPLTSHINHPTIFLASLASFVDLERIKEVLSDASHLIPFALFEVVYMLNAGFMSRGQLLANVSMIVKAGHRVRIVHGRADYVCQPKAAYLLYKALKNHGCKDVTLEFVAGAGHSDSEPGIIDALIRATNGLKGEETK